MVKQIAADIKKQLKILAQDVATEALRAPRDIAVESAKQLGLTHEEVRDLYGVKKDGAPPPPAAPEQTGAPVKSTSEKIELTRAKIQAFSQKRQSEWQKTAIQSLNQNQQHVDQLVESTLGHTPQGVPIKEAQKQEQKKAGLLDSVLGMFKGKHSRKMGAQTVGQAKKQSSGEFYKGQQ
jgi:hypothetical protein